MFKFIRNDGGYDPPIEYLPCSAITPKLGMALTQSSGNLAIATGTTKPTYICMVEMESAVSAGTVIPVKRVHEEDVYDTTFSASASGVSIGTKVTLHASSGMQVTATTSSGVAEVIEKDGSASGDHCRVRFS